MMTRIFTVVLNGTRQDLEEKENIIRETVSNMDEEGLGDRVVSRDRCERCGTPLHIIGLKKPSKCDICGTEIPPEAF